MPWVDVYRKLSCPVYAGTVWRYRLIMATHIGLCLANAIGVLTVAGEAAKQAGSSTGMVAWTTLGAMGMIVYKLLVVDYWEGTATQIREGKLPTALTAVIWLLSKIGAGVVLSLYDSCQTMYA